MWQAAQTRTDLAEIGGFDNGRLAVIAPDAQIPALTADVSGDRPESLDSGRSCSSTRRPPPSLRALASRIACLAALPGPPVRGLR
jgi:hypothetical protein